VVAQKEETFSKAATIPRSSPCAVWGVPYTDEDIAGAQQMNGLR
jgi:hypothetical protein